MHAPTEPNLVTGETARRSECATIGLTSAPSTVSSLSTTNPSQRSADHRIENTVHRLFLAQRQHPYASPVPSDPQPPAQQPAITVSKPQKSTLHSFWNIAAPPAQAPVFSYQTTPTHDHAHVPRCEDCDVQLEVEEGGMNVDVDMDSAGSASPLACHDCGRNVCGRCAVVGDVRHCLQCATHGY